jgi:hypothetical protein
LNVNNGLGVTLTVKSGTLLQKIRGAAPEIAAGRRIIFAPESS